MGLSEQRPYIGGQAVIEGVMMRSPRSFSVVVRRATGELMVRERPVPNVDSGGVARWPFIRGVTTLVESIKLGSDALRFSSEIYERDHQDGAPTGRSGVRSATTALALTIAGLLANDPEPKGDAPSTPTGPGEGGRRLFTALTIGFAILLFVVLPQAAAALTSRVGGLALDVRSAPFQAMTGAFKLAIVIGYLLLIRRVPEIRRVFQYHGAEHKTISTYEAGETLTVANAKHKTRLHPRCGTTFLVMVALVSILVFTAIAPILPHLAAGRLAENALLVLLKLPFLPIIAAVTFELQRVFARYCSAGPLRLVLWPGFLVQMITTIEPDDDQLEVALSSLQATLWRERAAGSAPAGATDRTFADFAALSADPGYGRAA